MQNLEKNKSSICIVINSSSVSSVIYFQLSQSTHLDFFNFFIIIIFEMSFTNDPRIIREKIVWGKGEEGLLDLIIFSGACLYLFFLSLLPKERLTVLFKIYFSQMKRGNWTWRLKLKMRNMKRNEGATRVNLFLYLLFKLIEDSLYYKIFISGISLLPFFSVH